MKCRFSLLVTLFLSLLLVGCSGPSAPALPETDYPMEFYFSSGAGAWHTEMRLNADGSFEGSFSDANMGEAGPNYPHGTVYLCSFSGRFVPDQAEDPHSFPLTLTQLTLDRPAGQEWIKDDIRYISSEPYGLEGGTEFMLYAPTTPVLGLDEELLSWWPDRFESQPPETLSRWCLWNVATGAAFFTYP